MNTKISCILFLAFCLSLVGSGFGEIFIGNAEFDDVEIDEGDYIYAILPWLYDYADASGDWPAWISNGWYDFEPEPPSELMFPCDTIVYQALSATYEEGGIYIYSLDVAIRSDADDWELFLYDATDGDHRTPLISRASTDPGEEPLSAYSEWFNKSITFTATSSEADHRIGVGFSGGWDTMIDNVDLTPPVGACLPDPYNGEINVLTNKTLSWHAGRDPNHPSLTNPAITGHELYMGSISPTDPNIPDLSYVTTIPATGDTAEYIPVVELDREMTYYWRVDELCEAGPNMITITGDVWKFQTVGTIPFIKEGMPAETLVDAGDDAVLTVTAFNPFTNSPDDLTFQWYKVGTPDDEMLSDGADYSDTQTASLTVLDAQIADNDEGWYYCVVTNTEGNTDSNTSRSAMLSIRKMLAHWPLDGNANDATGNGIDGTLIGTPVFVDGLVGQAMQFDSLDDYVDLPDGFDYFKSGLTFSVWAKPTALRDWARFFGFGNGPNEDNIAFSRIGTSDRVRFAIYDGDIATNLNVPDVIYQDEWRMFTVTLDNQGNAALYKNGMLLKTGSLAIPNVVARVNNFIGRSNWEDDSLYKGLMDDIRLYNYAFEPLEVVDLYLEVKSDETVCLSYPGMDVTGPDGEPDCVVGLSDFALMASQWMQCNIVGECI